MIVDAHTHIAESGRYGSRQVPATTEILLREMDRAGVEMSVVIPIPGVASNEFVHRETARFPSRLAALYTPDFSQRADTIPALERFAFEHKLRGLKIHPRVQRVSVEVEIVQEVLAWASEHGLPVVFDVFPWGGSLHDARLHPAAYHPVARKFPDLKIVLAHSGGHKVMDAFVTARANSNVFLDVSFTFDYYRGSSIAADLAFACHSLPVGRVVYGSDFPELDLAGYLETARGCTADLPPAHAAALFGDTSSALFGLAPGVSSTPVGLS